MAHRARLSAPRALPDHWPWHQAKWTDLPASRLFGGERRFDATNYLEGGYGVRLSIESRKAGWTNMGRLIAVSQPPRTKATLVSREFGTPFLIASQMFQIRPEVRKWLAIEKLNHAEKMFVKAGDILVRRSADVGKCTIALSHHEQHLISDHFFRLHPKDAKLWGWLYAYLRAPQTRAMMQAAQYGHIIKHLEPNHLNALPLPVLRDALLEEFNERATTLLEARDRAHALMLEAEALFSAVIGQVAPTDHPECGFSVKASGLFSTRRRLDASYHTPTASAILDRFTALGLKVEPLTQVTERVWWMTRFARVFGNEGVPYMSADELFSLNPTITKRVLIEQADNADDYFAKAGWILMACSGQVYGLNGSVALLTEQHENVFFSHDLIRIIPEKQHIRPGYLFVALGHPQIGRPLVIRYAYGTSIPHLEPTDIATFPVIRLAPAEETAIADMAEEAATLRAQADGLENALAADAETLIDRFMAGDQRDVAAVAPPSRA